MPKTLNDELVLTYVQDFIDFTGELPNELSPMVSQLFELDSKIRHQIGKIEHKMSRIAESTHTKRHFNKIDKYLGRVQRITEKKLKISEQITNLIKKKGKQLAEDYEGLLLSDQTESFTYGTRSGRMWTASITHSSQ